MATDKTSVQKREADTREVAERTRSGKVFIPAVDIFETNEAIFLIADMPGVDEKSININLEKNVLTIEGKVQHYEPEKMELAYAEYNVGDYQRSFNLSDSIDQDKIDATIKDGVLSVKLPKAEPAKPKTISVKTK
ncbi:MAG: Hsp20 family protein [Caldithrix sp.]|nr:Hsp20 family protein [Caldithrix sp.]